MTITEKIKSLKSSTITVEDLKAIKRWLNKGDILLLAQRHEISRQDAYHILQGRKKDPAFVSAAADMAIERQQTVLNKLHVITAGENSITDLTS